MFDWDEFKSGRKNCEEMQWESNTNSFIPKLKPGMVVELADGDRFLVVQTYDENLLLISNDGYDPIKYYDKNLKNTLEETCDIQCVYIPQQQRSLKWLLDSDNLQLLWKRFSKKKMTLAEIEKELGYEVEVVDEHE